MSHCSDCGKGFVQLGSGRPRKRCFDCAPSARPVKGDVQLSCSWCKGIFVGRSNARYCSEDCRDRAREDRRGTDCASCGKRIVSSRTSAVVQYCLTCRRLGLAPSTTKHGSSGRYKLGCRCAECRAGAAARMREYAARRKASGRPIDYAAYRPRVEKVCEQCGDVFLARVDKRAQRFCSLDCANDAQGRAEFPRSRFKVARSVRLSIFEAAGWKCELCESLTRPEEDYNHPRYPTLDHVVPRSRGGSDDVSNLRLACRQCNVLRGSNEDWVPGVTDEPVGGFASAV